MGETRKLTAILVADVVGYARLAGSDEERTLARLRALRSDLIDPTIALHHGRIVKRTGDGSIIELRSVVDAVRCAIEVQNGLIERNAGLPPERRIEFRVGIHVCDVVEESDGDLMGDGMNVATRLEGICQPGGVYLSEDAWRHVRDKIKEPFVDLGEQTLKNIPRPVRVFALKPQPGGAAHGVRGPTPEGREPPRLSIVVLPFANLGDPKQEYFADGVTDSLTTDLSRIRGAFVIGRSTAFTYKGQAGNVRQIGRELNVRYVLEGSVQRGGKRLRVNVQLLEAETANHIWAERFDKPVADLFEMQDEIVSRLANQLHVELVSAEARRSENATNPNLIDLLFAGAAAFLKGPTSENLLRARDFFERALALDPENAPALVMVAFVDFLIAIYFFPDDRAARLASAEAASLKAVSLNPQYALAHLCLGSVLGVTNRVEQGIAECERALAIDRNLANAHATIGALKSRAGFAEETEAYVREALRLSPRDSNVFYWLLFVGVANSLLGREEEAIAWLRRSIEANRNNPMSHFFLAAASALLGRGEEALAAARAGLALNPQFTIARFRASLWTDTSTLTYSDGRERIVEGLRKAGLPEGGAKTN